MRTLFVLAAASFAISAGAAQCAARSGPHTAALVELYASEGCARCPAAEHWLSRIAPRPNVLAVAIPVDEPGSRREATVRRRKLTHLQRLALVSTPQVLLQGREFRDWAAPASDDTLARIAAQAAVAWLALEIISTDQEQLRVRVAAATASGRGAAARLYLAAFGRDAVQAPLRVRQWQGPLELPGPGASLERVLPVPSGASGPLAGVVGFIESRRDSEVLQALMLPSCP